MEKYESLSAFYLNQIEDIHIDTMVIHIDAGTLYACPVIIPRANSVLSWSFISRYYDVDFRLTKDEDDGTVTTIIPSISLMHDVEHPGKIEIPKEGTYYLVWDNSSSWVRERVVEYSYNLTFPPLTVEEKNRCSTKVLQDLCTLQYSVYEHDQLIEEKNSELIALKTASNQRIAKKELISSKLSELKMEEEQCENSIHDYEKQIQNQQEHIKYLQSMAAFLIEDDRIFSFLDSLDILRLANVNHYLNDATHQDSVWKRLFKSEPQENLAIAVKNEWLLQKWRLFNPSQPVPK